MHSIVWQYVPEDQQMRVTAAMEAAGARATPDRPLAWIALEANRTVHHHELVVRHWPDGEAPRLLARAHPHGAWVQWAGECRPSPPLKRRGLQHRLTPLPPLPRAAAARTSKRLNSSNNSPYR